MHYINARKYAKRDMIIRFIAYAILAVVAVALTMLSVYAVLGYDVDRKTGQIIQNGLILVNSSPDRAFIEVNDKLERVRSPARLALPAGTYNVKLSLEGYRDWSSDVEVVGSQVSWLFYPKLVPQTIETNVVRDLSKIRTYQASPRQNLLAVNSDDDVSRIYFYNLRDTDEDPEVLTLPSDLVSPGVDPVIEPISWHGDERYMVISLMREDGRVYALIDIDEPQRSLLLPNEVFEAAEKVVFGNDSNLIFHLSEGILRAYNWAAGSNDLVGRNVSEVHHAPDGRTYVVTGDEGNELRYVDNLSLRLVSSFSSPVSFLDSGVFESQTFLVLRRGENQALLLRDPINAVSPSVPDRNFSLGANFEVEFSADDRFIRVSDKAGTLVYDLEDTKEYRLDVDSESILGWFDSTRLALRNDGIFDLVDFNGRNRFEIVDVKDGFVPTLDKSGETIMSLGTSSASGRTVLQLSSLVAE